MRNASLATEIARSPAAWEQLAKSWLIEVIERTPLDELDDLPLAWISKEATPLIAEILGQLSDPGSVRDLELPPATVARAASLAAQRESGDTVRRLPRELAALQTLLIDALDRQLPARERREFSNAVTRLSEVFGVVHSAAMESIADERAGHAPSDEETGLPGEPQLFETVRMLTVDSRRTAMPFTVAHFEVHGIERIGKGYGEGAARQMVSALAAILQGQLTHGEQAFRTGPGQFVTVSPGISGAEFSERAARIAELVRNSQGDRGPRVDVTVGLATHPESGAGASELLDTAAEAAWSARAAGTDVATASSHALQDR